MKIQGFLPIAAAALSLPCNCSETPVSRSDLPVSLSVTIETEHFIFHLAPGDRVDPDWQEAYHAWAIRELGVSSELDLVQAAVEHDAQTDLRRADLRTPDRGDVWMAVAAVKEIAGKHLRVQPR